MRSSEFAIIALFTITGLLIGTLIVWIRLKPDRPKAIGVWSVEKSPGEWVARSTDGHEWPVGITDGGQHLFTVTPLGETTHIYFGRDEAEARSRVAQHKTMAAIIATEGEACQIGAD